MINTQFKIENFAKIQTRLSQKGNFAGVWSVSSLTDSINCIINVILYII